MVSICCICVKLAVFWQGDIHGLKSYNIYKRACIDEELNGKAIFSGDHLDAETIKVAPFTHALACVGLSLK